MYIDEVYFCWFLGVADVIILVLFLRLLWLDRNRKY